MPKPSMEELEEILSGEDERAIEILPSGEIVAAAVKSLVSEVALPFVSSSAVIDKIQHAQEILEGPEPDLAHAVKILDEVIKQMPGWLFSHESGGD